MSDKTRPTSPSSRPTREIRQDGGGAPDPKHPIPCPPKPKKQKK
jgi:hypothetical protein